MVASLRTGIEQIEDVVVRPTTCILSGAGYAVRLCPLRESRTISADHPGSTPFDLVALVKLRIQDGRQDVREDKAAPGRDPGVLIDFSSEKRTPVRSLLPRDLGLLR